MGSSTKIPELEKVVKDVKKKLPSLANYRSKSILMDMLERRDELRFEVFVLPEEMALAEVVITRARRAESEMRALYQKAVKACEVTNFRAVAVDKRVPFVKTLLEEALESANRVVDLYTTIMAMLEECGLRYPWLRYIISTALYECPIPAIIYLADPPEACILGSIRGATNWAVGLIPVRLRIRKIVKNAIKEEEKEHRSEKTRFHYGLLCRRIFLGKYFTYDRLKSLIIDRCYRPSVVSNLFERILAVKKERYPKERQAFLNAFREFIQIHAINTYLVMVYYYYKTGLYKQIGIRPKPPKELADHPERWRDYINPIDLVHKEYIDLVKELIPDIEDITWKWFVQEVMEAEV